MPRTITPKETARSKELRAQQPGLLDKVRGIQEKAKAEKRALTADESSQITTLLDQLDELLKSIGTEEQAAGQEAADNAIIEETERSIRQHGERRTQPGNSREQRSARESQARFARRRRGLDASEEARSAFLRFCQHGPSSLSDAERRTMRADNNAKGGYLVVEQEIADELIRMTDNEMVIMGLADVHELTEARSLGIPTVAQRFAPAVWGTELGTISVDNNLGFGKRELMPHPLTHGCAVSNDLLMFSSRAESVVLEEQAYASAEAMETAFMIGDGANKPLGLFTPSASGVPISRDITTGNTATEFTGDSFIAAKYGLKQKYQNSPTTRWLLHRDAMMRAVSLKDGEGRYIWLPSFEAGAPATILNIGVVQSEYAPNTFTANQYFAVIGDFRYYRIVQVLSVMMKRLDEHLALQNQTGFLTRQFIDAAPVLPEAFLRMQLAA